MTLSELLTEFYARGFDYLNDGGAGETRAKRWINQSYQEICGLDDWPFLHTSTTGTAPLTIADMRTIESVVNTNTKQSIGFIDERTVTEAYPDLAISGSPQYAYMSGDALSTYPTNSDTLKVTYFKVPTDLSSGTDQPIIPARYQYAIVDFACGRAYMDSDNVQMAQAVRADGDTVINSMREHLLYRQHQDPDQLVAYGFSTDFT